jgi:hypothetical protein
MITPSFLVSSVALPYADKANPQYRWIIRAHKVLKSLKEREPTSIIAVGLGNSQPKSLAPTFPFRN